MSSSDPNDPSAAPESAPRDSEHRSSSGPPAAGRPPESDLSPVSRFREQASSKQSGADDDDEEQALWSGGYSGKAMVGTWILLVIVGLALLILPFFVPAFPFPIALGLVLLAWVVGGVIYAYRRLGVHYQLTDQRFVHQTGVLTRRTDRIEVIDIDDVTCTQGPVQRAFGVGTIVLTGSDRTHPTLSMIGIAGVRDVASLIDDTRRKERRRRSLHIEAI
jgi:membrane protein YdbS with pleckstrin-like domain